MPVGDVVVLARVVGNVVQASCLERVAVCGGVAGFGQTVDDIRPGRWGRRVVVYTQRKQRYDALTRAFSNLLRFRSRFPDGAPQRHVRYAS